jgi:RNA polymerase-binding transcription factor DksA
MDVRKQSPRPPRGKPRASSEDVLGKPERKPQINPKWREHYGRLTELLSHLQQNRGNLAKDALEEQPTFSTHMADAGTDTFDRDFALGMLSSRQDAVYEIEAALIRIREGTYGLCELTGKPIDPARLEAIPWTRFTAEAEKQLENEGAVKRVRLGPRESVVRAETTTEADED